MSEVKELRVSPKENAKRVLYLAKESLLENDFLELVSGAAGSAIVTRAAESLVRLGYATYDKIRTDTILVNDKRRTKFVIRVLKTNNFKALYDENEEIRKKTEEFI